MVYVGDEQIKELFSYFGFLRKGVLTVKKLLVCMCLGLFLLAAPASAVVQMGLPQDINVNFNGNGVFAQVPVGEFEWVGEPGEPGSYLRPLPAVRGTELFGTGTISDVDATSAPGAALWVPADVDSNFELTFVFWDAIVTSSTQTDPGGGANVKINTNYADEARLLLVADTTKDFDPTLGAGAFDLQDGEYPTAYTLEDAGYDTDGLADGTSPKAVADDAGEEVFLDLLLSGNSSELTWNPNTNQFTIGTFQSTSVEILGGAGAAQFADFIGKDGEAAGLILNFSPTGWAFGGDIDIQLHTIPEPATLVFLSTGLVSLFGYGIRRRMS